MLLEFVHAGPFSTEINGPCVGGQFPLWYVTPRYIFYQANCQYDTSVIIFYFVTATAQMMVSLCFSSLPGVSLWIACPEFTLHIRILSTPPVTMTLSGQNQAIDRIRPEMGDKQQ